MVPAPAQVARGRRDAAPRARRERVRDSPQVPVRVPPGNHLRAAAAAFSAAVAFVLFVQSSPPPSRERLDVRPEVEGSRARDVRGDDLASVIHAARRGGAEFPRERRRVPARGAPRSDEQPVAPIAPREASAKRALEKLELRLALEQSLRERRGAPREVHTLSPTGRRRGSVPSFRAKRLQASGGGHAGEAAQVAEEGEEMRLRFSGGGKRRRH